MNKICCMIESLLPLTDKNKAVIWSVITLEAPEETAKTLFCSFFQMLAIQMCFIDSVVVNITHTW